MHGRGGALGDLGQQLVEHPHLLGHVGRGRYVARHNLLGAEVQRRGPVGLAASHLELGDVRPQLLPRGPGVEIPRDHVLERSADDALVRVVPVVGRLASDPAANPHLAHHLEHGLVGYHGPLFRPEAHRYLPVLLASIYFSPVSLIKRAVRTKAASPVALTYFHRFRSRLDGSVPRQVLQPVGPARYLDQVAVVAHPVRDRARRHVVPEHPAPAADPHVGGDDRRALLVARRYQLEQQVRTRAADVEVAELVDDQQPRVGVVLEPLLEDAARRGVLKVHDEPGAVHEPDLAPRPDRLDAQRDGEVRLAHAGAPHEQDVLGPLHEPVPVHAVPPRDLAEVRLGAGPPVDVQLSHYVSLHIPLLPGRIPDRSIVPFAQLVKVR